MKKPISLDWEDTFPEALAFAQVLCLLGYGMLIVPHADGRCLIFYQPKEDSNHDVVRI